jgi:hypothetical protein
VGEGRNAPLYCAWVDEIMMCLRVPQCTQQGSLTGAVRGVRGCRKSRDRRASEGRVVRQTEGRCAEVCALSVLWEKQDGKVMDAYGKCAATSSVPHAVCVFGVGCLRYPSW